ncbi:hypothetical protein [Pseudoalteromonas sp. MMG005]|uniref:hypothetical protein n=1 Tax=Pseudoalteromonas sp. MMG005 TaxID=2822682 RepID=UPI001B3A61BA|nr:hypothetical protein [Pseudoalteromonas sp. MMG005]MBQ4846993.1 hypothetical protein [Pseudoalteromonas sp. MMG005]
MLRKLSLLSTLLLTACTHTDAIKTPDTVTASVTQVASQTMRADVTVSGRTSKLNHIDIAFMGKNIPRTYSDNKISNSRGYDWWVSKHFALKSDLPEDKVRLYLELLEMSYPHYVELFGMEPANIANQRIAVVYGSSRARLREAMLDDGFLRGVHKTAGGETMFYNRAGYNFPSHRQHHQRYIVIHETMHAFHMALNGHSTWAPNWITEGLADSIASHVYDPQSKELTVMVFDRAPMNYIKTGLKQYKAANSPTIEQINDDPALKRGLNFFIVHFLMSDPVRQLYFKRFLANLMAENPHSDQTLPTANKLLKATFPNWQAVEHQFQAFVENISPTFKIVSGPWEQNGGAYWLRSDESTQLHQLKINPNAQAQHPVLDFPKPLTSPLVDISQKNTIAAHIDFEPSQFNRGEIGLGLVSKNAQADTPSVPLLISQGTFVKLDLTSINKGSQVLALQPSIVEAIQKEQALGLSIVPAHNKIQVIVATQQHRQTVNFDSSIELDPYRFDLLGQGMNHQITPYISQHSHTVAQLGQNNPDPWLYDQPALVLRAFNTCQKFANILANCHSQLTPLISKLPDTAQHTLVTSAVRKLLTDWKRQLPNEALMTLSGIKVSTYYEQGQPYLAINNPTQSNITVSVQQQQLATAPSGISHMKLDIPTKFNNAKHLPYELRWDDSLLKGQLDLQASAFDGVYLDVVEKDEQLSLQLSGPYSGKTTGKITVQFSAFDQPKRSQELWQQDVSLAPYEHKTWQPSMIDIGHLTHGRIEISAVLDVDGEPIKLTQYITL